MQLMSPDPGTQLVDKIISYLFIIVFIWVVIEVLNNSLAWKILKKQIYAALRLNLLKLKFKICGDCVGYMTMVAKLQHPIQKLTKGLTHLITVNELMNVGSFRREAGEVAATVEGVSSSAEQWSSLSVLTVCEYYALSVTVSPFSLMLN
ncbi:uncharacterized protein DS421_13g393220 [Arachis hypogaea]|nr:uncharacterized protein DS421_13g393220 [Arachis hypogaea]